MLMEKLIARVAALGVRCEYDAAVNALVRDAAVNGRVVAAVSPTLFAVAPGNISYQVRAGDTVTLTVTDANDCEDDTSGEVSFTTCECDNCTPTSTPDEVLVDLQNGTSPWGCTVCTGLGGAYVLDCVGFCTWEYTGVSAGSCRVCASPTTPVVVNLVITAAVVTSGGNKILQVTVRFTYASSGGTGCETGTAVYQFNLGSGSVNCFGSRTLSKTSSSGTNLCDHGATVDLTI